MNEIKNLLDNKSYENLLEENKYLKRKIKKMEDLLNDNMFTKCIVCENYFSGFESFPLILGCMDVKKSMLELHTNGINCFNHELNTKLSNPWCSDCIPDDNISKKIENLNSLIVINTIYNFNETGSPTPGTRICLSPKLDYRLYLPFIDKNTMLNDLKKVGVEWNETMGLEDLNKITNSWGINKEIVRSELLEASYIINSSKISEILTKEEKINRVKKWMEYNV